MAWIVLAALLAAAVWTGRRAVSGARGARPLRDTGRHYRRCYSRRGFLRYGAALLVAGALVYSGADEALDQWHRRSIRGAASDAVARRLKFLGERFFFLYWGVFALLDGLWRSTALSRWGRRNFEAMVVGLPALWTMQYGLGASRPTDSGNTAGPRWRRPFHDDNSASGHAFMGAIPFLTLARAARAPLPRAAALTAAAGTGWSRLNDRKHYLSQVLLGWAAAWRAVEAVTPPGQDAQRASVMRPAPDPASDSRR